jgi:hypothetical protein
MNLSRAVQDLEENGSSQDPIWYKGEETTPEQLEWKVSDNRHGGMAAASKIRITYYGYVKGDCLKKVNGTLSGMVRDRRILHADNERKLSDRARAKKATEAAHRQARLEEQMCDPDMTLIQWLELIASLIKTHGPDVKMYTDSGYNNCELRIDDHEEV